MYRLFGNSFLVLEFCIAETYFIIRENQKLKIEILVVGFGGFFFIFLPEITAHFCVKPE